MPPLPRSRFRSRSRILLLGLAVGLAWILWAAWVHRGHWVDDAFISFRYAASWLAGDGLVFNPGERVEGVTNLGWVWVVALASLPAPASLPVVAKVLGLLSLAATVLLASLAHRRLAPSASGAELALLPVLLASSPELVYFSLAGMETGLAALLLVAALACLLREAPRLLPAAALSGLLFAVRPETVVLFPLFAAALLLAPGPLRRSRVVGALGVFGAVVLALTWFRLGYYGEPLPNTVVAKSPGGAAELLRRGWETFAGRNVNAPAPWVGSVVSFLGGLGVWILWRPGTSSGRVARRPAALLLASGATTGLAFAVYAPPDWTGMGRYFAPYVPFAAVLVLRGLFGGAARLTAAVRSPPSSDRSAVLAAALAGLLLAGVGLWRTHTHLSAAALGEYPGFVLASETLIGPARWIDRHLPPDVTIAARRIGTLGYFGRRPVLDFAFGLTDPEVARRRRAAGGEIFRTPASEALAPVWTRRPPECLLEDEDVTAPLLENRFGDRLTLHGVRYREVRRFPLGVGAGDWVLACRPGAAGR